MANLDPRPLAAFRLGLLSRTIWSWLTLFWEMPWYEGTDDGVPLAVDQLKEARRNLADVVHPNVFLELPRVLDRFVDLNNALIAFFAKGILAPACLESGVPWAPELLVELRQLADRALPAGHLLRRLYELGVALGEYELALGQQRTARDGPYPLEALPEVRPLALLALSLPQEILTHSPLLGAFARSAAELDRIGQARFLENYYNCNKGFWPYDLNSRDQRSTDPRLNLMLFKSIFSTLGDQIQEGLKEITFEEWEAVCDRILSSRQDGPMGADKPSWDKGLRELRYRGRVVREVKALGENIILILDAFEECGWPALITDPLSGPREKQSERRYDTIRSLNENLAPQSIRFHVDGERIRWSAD